MSSQETVHQLWKGFGGHGLYAKRAEKDRNGEDIVTTYAKQSEVPALTDDLTTSTTTAVTPGAVKEAIDAIVKIPDTANQPSTLYVGGQGMGWTGWETEEKDIPISKKLLYLTYFTNFNESTKTDTSLIGDGTITFTGLGTHSFPKLNVMQTSVPGMEWHSVNLVQESTGITIPDDVNQISIEQFFATYCPGDYGTHLKVGYLWNYGCGAFSGDGYRLDVSWANLDNLTFYNGASYNTAWGKWALYKPASEYGVNVSTAGNMHFYSCVVDFETAEAYLYVDGLIICKATNITINRDIRYRLDTHRSDHWIKATQCAIFNYAKNSDDKMTYPVPESPYDPSVVEAP